MATCATLTEMEAMVAETRGQITQPEAEYALYMGIIDLFSKTFPVVIVLPESRIHDFENFFPETKFTRAFSHRDLRSGVGPFLMSRDDSLYVNKIAIVRDYDVCFLDDRNFTSRPMSFELFGSFYEKKWNITLFTVLGEARGGAMSDTDARGSARTRPAPSVNPVEAGAKRTREDPETTGSS